MFSDLSDAIDQLIYIAEKKEVKKLKALKGEEQISAFNAFWKKRDFTPETRYNEYMNEYYNRINIANQKYGGYYNTIS